ncbi:MAG: carboxypeptidase-like regulatory domain-containing protein [Bacteroidetes bacterium]|nr:carboxypeptidase-like regulatory domain-containing protein [Bacteroidota bacterium]
MLKKILVAIVFQGSTMLFSQECVLKIEVSDSSNREALEMVSVAVASAGITTCTGMTDKDGNIVFKNLYSGRYDVKAIYTGYQKKMIAAVLVKNNETTYLYVKLSSQNIMNEFVVIDYVKPLIDPNTSIKTTFTYDEIQRSPYSNVNDFMSTVSGSVQKGEGTTPYFRGARSSSVVYIVDGQPVSGTLGVPLGAIQQMSVTLGGVPAKYGDATGAFIEIETRSGLGNY